MRVISLGAGVQSSTMLLMALCGELERPDCAIFADTGWEPRAVYVHLDWLDEQCQQAGMPLYRVSAGHIRHKTTNPQGRKASLPFHIHNQDGKRSMIKRQCTSDYKIVPIERKLRDLLGVAKGRRVPKGVQVEQWIGISLDEVIRMKDNLHKWITNVYPLIDRRMTRHDCLLWLARNGYPIPPKSACIGCPFHSDDFWRGLRDNSPEEWADAVEFDAAIRSLKRIDGAVYLHRSLMPLSEVDLSTEADHGQLDLFGNECEGMCGV